MSETETDRLIEAVSKFSAAMLSKLLKKLREGWDNTSYRQIVADKLQAHYERFMNQEDDDQAVDVANLVMILALLREKDDKQRLERFKERRKEREE